MISWPSCFFEFDRRLVNSRLSKSYSLISWSLTGWYACSDPSIRQLSCDKSTERDPTLLPDFIGSCIHVFSNSVGFWCGLGILDLRVWALPNYLDSNGTSVLITHRQCLWCYFDRIKIGSTFLVISLSVSPFLDRELKSLGISPKEGELLMLESAAARTSLTFLWTMAVLGRLMAFTVEDPLLTADFIFVNFGWLSFCKPFAFRLS